MDQSGWEQLIKDTETKLIWLFKFDKETNSVIYIKCCIFSNDQNTASLLVIVGFVSVNILVNSEFKYSHISLDICSDCISRRIHFYENIIVIPSTNLWLGIECILYSIMGWSCAHSDQHGRKNWTLRCCKFYMSYRTLSFFYFIGEKSYMNNHSSWLSAAYGGGGHPSTHF